MTTATEQTQELVSTLVNSGYTIDIEASTQCLCGDGGLIVLKHPDFPKGRPGSGRLEVAINFHPAAIEEALDKLLMASLGWEKLTREESAKQFKSMLREKFNIDDEAQGDVFGRIDALIELLGNNHLIDDFFRNSPKGR